MKTLTSLVCITAFLHQPVYAYNTNRYGDSCYYYENPNMVPIFRSRSSGSMSPYVAQDVTPAENKVLYGYFPGQDIEAHPDELMKNFNIGYLNVKEPISSIGDLMEMNSEEIGYPEPPLPRRETVKPWNVDEVKNLAAPEVLPDIVLHPEPVHGEETSEVQLKQPVLDEHEIKLGRKLVDDSPSIPDLMPVEKSLRQEAEDMGDTEIDEQYLRAAQINAPPSVVLDTIIPREEPDFMDELEQIKSGNVEHHPSEKQEENEDNYEQVTSVPISSDVPAGNLESTTDSMPTSTASVPENTIEKDTNEGTKEENLPNTDKVRKNSQRSSKKKKKSKEMNTEQIDVNNSETPEISTRLSGSNDTLLDGLLSVM